MKEYIIYSYLVYLPWRGEGCEKDDEGKWGKDGRKLWIGARMALLQGVLMAGKGEWEGEQRCEEALGYGVKINKLPRESNSMSAREGPGEGRLLMEREGERLWKQSENVRGRRGRECRGRQCRSGGEEEIGRKTLEEKLRMKVCFGDGQDSPTWIPTFIWGSSEP